MCGADEVDLFEAMCHQGSSPRVRSRPLNFAGLDTGTRIISACAEQTFPRGDASSDTADHLRVCGADLETNQ